MKPRLLIIRFSSFGDIFHALRVPHAFIEKYPDAEIHWVVRKDFEELIHLSPFVHKVWAFDRKLGFKGLLEFAKILKQINWSHIYDAHNNLRSLILCCFLKAPNFARRPKERFKRLLQFKLHLKMFKMPYLSQASFLKPLENWGLKQEVSNTASIHIDNDKIEKLISSKNLKKPYVTLAPSAAWTMKRWPPAHWKKLISLLADQNIVLLGGPNDHFIQDLVISQNVINLAGQLSLLESCTLAAGSSVLASADTGIMHFADLNKTPTIALIGPTAFGYPSSQTSKTVEVQLYCKPCSKDGRGRCRNKVYQKCMIDITPETVEKMVRAWL